MDHHQIYDATLSLDYHRAIEGLWHSGRLVSNCKKHAVTSGAAMASLALRRINPAPAAGVQWSEGAEPGREWA